MSWMPAILFTLIGLGAFLFVTFVVIAVGSLLSLGLAASILDRRRSAAGIRSAEKSDRRGHLDGRRSEVSGAACQLRRSGGRSYPPAWVSAIVGCLAAVDRRCGHAESPRRRARPAWLQSGRAASGCRSVFARQTDGRCTGSRRSSRPSTGSTWSVTTGVLLLVGEW